MADIVGQTVSLLSTNWTAANTGSVTPKIDESFDVKRYRYSRTAVNNGDTVFAYSGTYTQEADGVNKTHVNTQDPITIDVRTAVSRAHAILLRDEVKRILGANFNEPVTGQREVEIEEIQDMADKLRLFWRFIFMLRYKAYHIAR